MRKLLSVIFIAGVIFACDTPKKKEVKEVKEPKSEQKEKVTLGATRFEELKGYFVKNNVTFDKDYKYIVVSSQEGFNKYFGMGKTMNNEVTPLDFEKFNIAAIMIKPSNKVNKIKMEKYTSEGAKTIVGFSVEAGEEQTFTSGELLLFKIPKSRTSVDFVSNGETLNVEVK